jgi:DNA segregation ATPase FtsK/SpoIIIE-like protein
VSIIVGTQYPTSRVISPQLKANLTKRIAFRTSTRTESQVILDRNGAEALGRPGLALTYIGQRWREVQVLRAGDEAFTELVSVDEENELGPALSDVEVALVRYAVEELDGAFTVNRLYDALGDEISRRQINYRAKDWERRGWLTPPQRDESGHPIGRQVTPELKNLAGIAPVHEGPTEALESGNAVTRVSERNKAQNPGNRGGNRAVTGPEDVVERRSPDTALLPPHYCPVTACRWNSEGRGVCDYAQRGLRCGDPRWRDEWREAMDVIEEQEEAVE